MLGDWITREGQKDHHPDGRTTPPGSRTSLPINWSDR
jgi:hypothetical protein